MTTWVRRLVCAIHTQFHGSSAVKSDFVIGDPALLAIRSGCDRRQDIPAPPPKQISTGERTILGSIVAPPKSRSAPHRPSEASDGTLEQSDGVTFALFRRLDDALRDELRRRISSVNEPQLAERFLELVAHAPDVLLANGSPTTGPLLQSTRTIPIVFVQVADPIGATQRCHRCDTFCYD
jgi:hypothetical protein